MDPTCINKNLKLFSDKVTLTTKTLNFLLKATVSIETHLDVVFMCVLFLQYISLFYKSFFSLRTNFLIMTDEFEVPKLDENLSVKQFSEKLF